MLEKITEILKKNEKNCKKLIFDAHFHYAQCVKLGLTLPDFGNEYEWRGISCAHSKAEFKLQFSAPPSVIQSYGMHPQSAANEIILESADFLEKLLQTKKISFIGEAGFDFFNDEFTATSANQEKIWNIQLDLALKYNVPLVIHCRKANHKLFEYSKKLSRLSEVLFHSFMGQPQEAFSLLNHEINGFFSFGKQLLNGNKKAISCVRELPSERLLPETDAPFQTLKGEEYTKLSDIKLIYEEFKKNQKF